MTPQEIQALYAEAAQASNVLIAKLAALTDALIAHHVAVVITQRARGCEVDQRINHARLMSLEEMVREMAKK